VKIDIYTFAIVLGIVYAIQFIIFFIEYNNHRIYQGPGWWLNWSGAAVMGFLFMVARRVPSFEHFAMLGQNLMFLLSFSFLYVGIMRFLEKPIRYRLITFVFVLFILPFSFFDFVRDDIYVRTILLWSTVAVLSTLYGYILFKNRPKLHDIALTICILVFFGHAIFSISKVLFLLTGSTIDQIFSPEILNYSTYFELLIVTIFWTYALIMMINHRLSEDMRRMKDHFEAIYKTSPDAILITDMEHGIIGSVNEKFYEITGYTEEEVIGKSTIELHIWHNLLERSRYIQLVRENGRYFNFESNFLCKNGKNLAGLLSGSIIRLNDESHLITIIHDISARKKREMEILQQNTQLQILNAEKDKLFSIIAHDLKSPFSSFLGLTEIMADEMQNLPIGEVIQLAARMRDSARNLYGLLENLLEWSLVKQGVTKFNPRQIALLPEVNECILTYLDASRKKNIGIDIDISTEITVFADENMLRSLIRNLLSNAIKFTPNDGTVYLAAGTTEDGSCLFSVKDTGIGMSNNMQRDLFKLDANLSRKGTNGELSCGLGLLLCKEFVDQHQGEIWTMSEVDKGSTFFVKLPPTVILPLTC